MNTKTIKLTHNELIPLLNILNEVANGIHVNNFEKAIGVNEKFVDNLWDKISKEEGKKESVIILNNLELEVVKNSFVEVYKEIEEWEFQTRLGITISEMKKIQNKILSEIDLFMKNHSIKC